MTMLLSSQYRLSRINQGNIVVAMKMICYFLTVTMYRKQRTPPNAIKDKMPSYLLNVVLQFDE